MLILACTRWGAGLGGDAYAYIASARNLAAGLGLSVLGPTGEIRTLTIFAPLFPALLGLGEWLGADAWTTARGLNAALMGINVALVMSLLWRFGGGAWPALVAGVMTVFSAVILSLHTGVLSEPLFFTFLLLSVLGLASYLDTERIAWVVLSGLAGGLAYLARYAGIMLLGSGALILLLSGPVGWRRRLRAAGAYGAAMAVFVLAWFGRNALAGGSATARSLVLDPVGFDVLRELADIVSFWYLPERIPLGVRTAFVILAAAGLGVALVRERRRSSDASRPAGEAGGRMTLSIILAMTILIYGMGILVTRSLFIPRISIDHRIFSPVLLLSMPLLVALVHGLWEKGGRFAKTASITALLLLTALTAARGAVRVLQLQWDGEGYASRTWQESQLLIALRLVPPEIPVYTNEVEAVYLLTGRTAFRLPTGCLPTDALYLVPPGTECRTEAYREWAASMRSAIEHEMAVVALFNSYSEQPSYAQVAPELVEGLDVLSSQGDGVLFVEDKRAWPDNPHW